MRPQSSPGFKGLPLVAKAGRRRHCVPRALVARERVMSRCRCPNPKTVEITLACCKLPPDLE